MTIETVADAAGGMRVLRADGDLDVAVAPGLGARVAEFVEGAAAVVLDLRPVTFLDSSGVRLLDTFAHECGQRGVGFVAVSPEAPGPRRVLEIVGFGPPLVFDELSTAMASVAPRTA